MAYIQNRGTGWLAQIKRQGWPVQNRTFQTRADAEKWARAVEREMDMGAYIRRDEAERTTFQAAAKRYMREVLPSKRSRAQDGALLSRLVERFGRYSMSSLSSDMLAAYRDERLKILAPQTVVHELNMVSRVCAACIKDWGIPLPHGNPLANVRKPRLNNERDRRLEPGEEALLLDAFAREGRNPWVRPMVILAAETAARQSELLSLRWDEVDLKRATARLRGKDGRVTKNNDPYRDVPLTPRAVTTLSALPRSIDGRVFPTSQNSVQLVWKRTLPRARRAHLHGLLRGRLQAEGIDADTEIRALVFKKREPLPRTLALLAEIEKADKTLVDLHFHDLRHEATSRLAEVLQMHELMKVTGHKSSKMLARYYHPRAEDLAAKIRAAMAAAA
ncbi:MAG: site-specific integrase [Betaproteobacteria bacterium]|nr:site-specific integrase [Betaproteobacteria bacterium]